MPVSVMEVRIVPMAVPLGNVPVEMTVRFRCRGSWRMIVLMVFVVFVHMLVDQRLVEMLVLMPFDKM